MATIYRCDRCKTETRNSGEFRSVTVQTHAMLEDYSFDLCDNCARQVLRFIKDMVEVTP